MPVTILSKPHDGVIDSQFKKLSILLKNKGLRPNAKKLLYFCICIPIKYLRSRNSEVNTQVWYALLTIFHGVIEAL